MRSFEAILNGNEKSRVELFAGFDAGREKPIVRGSRREYENSESGQDCTVYCDGRVEFRWKRFWSGSKENRIFIGWILGSVANVTLMAEAFASAAGVPGSEYALEVEAISFATGAGVPFELCGFRGPDAVVGKIDGPFIQRYELAMDKDEILGNILTDLLDAAGEPIEKPAMISLVNWP
jgi:hypothetical protein